MHSIRRSLTSYLLALLVITLAVVGIVIDQVTGSSLQARQKASEALIDAQFEERCREERQRMDTDLLQEARKLGREMQKEYLPRSQREVAKYNLLRVLLSFGHGQPLATATYYANPTTYFGHFREYFRRLPIDEEMLRHIEDPDKSADLFQVSSPSGRTNWRSESLGEESLPPVRVDDWAFDDSTMTPSNRAVRRVVMRVSLQVSAPPMPSRNRGRPGSGPPMPGMPPSVGGPPGMPGGSRPGFYGSLMSWLPPSSQFADFLPLIYIHAARPMDSLTETITTFTAERDTEKGTITTQISLERRELRVRLLIIGLATFLCIAIGGPLLIAAGLRPLRDLSDAVSQVSEKDFKLPHAGHGLPNELTAIHDRLTQTLAMLRRAFAREKQAVADISHELRTPIASVQATLDVALRKPRTPEQYRTTLEECRIINRQLGQLVERIMTLASLDSGNDRTDPIRTDASEIASACASVIRPLAISHGLTLKVDVDSPLELDTDPDKLREVLMNLLHNAVEYNSPSGSIELAGHRENGHVRFEVRDTGIGMTPEVRERIFERFFRADESRHATGVHAGLGLAIVREYVDRLGGAIDITSEPNRGSQFRLTFPAPHDAEPSSSASADRGEPNPAGS